MVMCMDAAATDGLLGCGVMDSTGVKGRSSVGLTSHGDDHQGPRSSRTSRDSPLDAEFNMLRVRETTSFPLPGKRVTFDGTVLRQTSSALLHPLSRACLLNFKDICQEGNSARLVLRGGRLCTANSGLVPRDTGDVFSIHPDWFRHGFRYCAAAPVYSETSLSLTSVSSSVGVGVTRRAGHGLLKWRLTCPARRAWKT